MKFMGINDYTITYCFLFISYALFIGVFGFVDNGFSMADHIEAGDKNNYIFEMDKNSQDALLNKAKMLQVGDSVNQVKSILGEPASDQKIINKIGEFKARVFYYYIKIWKEGIANEKRDLYLRIEFDNRDQIIDISSNIESFHVIKDSSEEPRQQHDP